MTTPPLDTNTTTTQPIAEHAEATMEHAVSTVKGWFEIVREYFKDYPTWAVEIAIFGLGSFVLGFVTRFLSRLFFPLIVGTIVGLFILYYYDIVHVDIEHLRELFGLQEAHSFDEIFKVATVWVREHMVATISAVVGFILGWKLG